MSLYHPIFFLFFFNDTATTEIYTLSLHDALPISSDESQRFCRQTQLPVAPKILLTHGFIRLFPQPAEVDRKSTRLNSSHGYISYAVFCLKKKKKSIHY